jgi:hypothetical protein
MESAFGVIHELSKRLPSSINRAPGALKRIGQVAPKAEHPYIKNRREAHQYGRLASKLISERGGSREKPGWTTARWTEGDTMQSGFKARMKSRKALG